MRFRLALAVSTFVTLNAWPAVAQQCPPGYWCWCEPARGYYPYVPTCPVPWRPVLPRLSAAPSQSPNGPRAQSPPPAADDTLNSFPALGDGLDDWCAKVKLPSSIAICSDAELRALTIERQKAFNETRGRIGEDRAPALLADQNGWVKSYPEACGLSPNTPLVLPLTPTIKECMVRAGRARIAYLQAYGVAPGTANATPIPTPTEATAPAPAATPPAICPDGFPDSGSGCPRDSAQAPTTNPLSVGQPKEQPPSNKLVKDLLWCITPEAQYGKYSSFDGGKSTVDLLGKCMKQSSALVDECMSTGAAKLDCIKIQFIIAQDVIRQFGK
jgi:hypothetical protein